MTPFRSPVFVVSCLLFILHQVLQKGFNVSIPIIDQYLDSLLAMPIILTFLLAERQYLFKKGKQYRLPLLDVVLATLFIAFVSEVVFPFLSNDFTGDWLDLGFYAIGSGIFHFTINRKPTK